MNAIGASSNKKRLERVACPTLERAASPINGVLLWFTSRLTDTGWGPPDDAPRSLRVKKEAVHVIVVDVHERSMDIDVTLSLPREICGAITMTVIEYVMPRE